MTNMKQTFEEYLRDNCWDAEGILDDDMSDAFDTWCAELDVQEVMDYAEQFAGKRFQEGYFEGQSLGIVQGGELGTQIAMELLRKND